MPASRDRRLLDELITAAQDTEHSVAALLRKLKVAAHRARSPALLAWIELEVRGYGTDDPLPPYRQTTPVVPRAVGIDGYRPLGVDDLPPELRGCERFTHSAREPIDEIERCAARKQIEVPWRHTDVRAAYTFFLRERNPGDSDRALPWPRIEYVVRQAFFRDVLTAIRDRVLDLALLLDDEASGGQLWSCEEGVSGGVTQYLFFGANLSRSNVAFGSTSFGQET